MSDERKPDWKCRLDFVGDNDANLSGRSRKFWQAEVWGKTFVRRWGPIGKTGQTMKQTFATKYEATQAALKMANEKRRKGYTNEVDIVTLIGSLFEGEAA
jgi:predicted DNA-binding WGR domain protein